MKKIKQLLAIIAISVMTLPAFAQEDSVVFKPHFKLGLQVGASYTIGETSFTNLISPAAALNFGYDFSPVFGVRLNVSGWQSKGYMPSLEEGYKFNYVQAGLDLTADIRNLFGENKFDRVFNPYLFVGVGYNYGFNNDEALVLSKSANMEYIWEENQSLLVGRFGIGAEFRITEVIALTLEVNSNLLSDKYNSKKAGNLDWQFNALAGITFNLGKTTATVARPQVEYAPAPEVAPEPEPQPVVEEAPAPVANTVVVVAEKTENIFFTIDSAVISEDGQATVNELADFMKANPTAKISLNGYADVKTGNESINSRIATRRVEAVKDALVEKGVAEGRISTKAYGDSEQPFAENAKNRVVICVAK
ncbi:MAG: OmpA family protein [Rikenellaceae bacterium]